MTPQEVFELVDASLDWDDFAALAADCRLPMLIKGIHTAEDARLAVEHGAAGVVVSNHGGRQLDGVPASLDMLPEVVEAADGRCEVLMDGGIRRGTDVVIALALGAKAVLAGRAPLWGLAVEGESGARRVLEILRDEIALALTLLGCPSPADVTVEHVQRAPIFDSG
jgi:isopentenyl diphosphate isomerase/L-lactate dehydrogenase-like FMN-dependent dehydrogenase